MQEAEARQAAVERQRSDASRAEIEREVRDDGVWREWHSRINGGGAATGGLCVRTCSLQRVIGYLQSVKDGSLAGDDPHFNISYIIRQVMPMHPGPPAFSRVHESPRPVVEVRFVFYRLFRKWLKPFGTESIG